MGLGRPRDRDRSLSRREILSRLGGLGAIITRRQSKIERKNDETDRSCSSEAMTAHNALLHIDPPSPTREINSTSPSQILHRDSFPISRIDSLDEIHDGDNLALSLQELFFPKVHR